MKKRIHKLSIFVALLLIASADVFGQAGNNSPYSRYGLGDIYTNDGLVTMAMGGTTLGYRSSFNVNPQNPASYTEFDTMSFRFEGSFYSRVSTWKTDTESQKSSYGSLGHLLFGLPVTKWMKASFGIMPFSSVGYTMRNKQIADGIGSTSFNYTGTGGINQFYIGAGIQPLKNLSIGANASYLFGNIDRSRDVTFPDSVHLLYTHFGHTDKVGHPYFSFGSQYHKINKNHSFLNIGVVYSPKQNLSTTYDDIVYSYIHEPANDFNYNFDTLSYSSKKKASVIIPANYGVGAMFGKVDKWMGGFDVQFQDWSKYRYNDQSDSLGNSLRISIGAQITPDFYSVGKFWKRVTYRGGFRFNQTYVNLRNKAINEYGLTFGIGIPTRRTQRDFRTSLNIAMEVGTRGTTGHGLIKENYFRLSFGLALFDRWFIQRKYE